MNKTKTFWIRAVSMCSLLFFLITLNKFDDYGYKLEMNYQMSRFYQGYETSNREAKCKMEVISKQILKNTIIEYCLIGLSTLSLLLFVSTFILKTERIEKMFLFLLH